MLVWQGEGQVLALPVLLQKYGGAAVKRAVFFGTAPQQSIPRGKPLVTQLGVFAFVKVKRRVGEVLGSSIIQILVAIDSAEAELVDGTRPFQDGPLAA